MVLCRLKLKGCFFFQMIVYHKSKSCSCFLTAIMCSGSICRRMWWILVMGSVDGRALCRLLNTLWHYGCQIAKQFSLWRHDCLGRCKLFLRPFPSRVWVCFIIKMLVLVIHPVHLACGEIFHLASPGDLYQL